MVEGIFSKNKMQFVFKIIYDKVSFIQKSFSLDEYIKYKTYIDQIKRDKYMAYLVHKVFWNYCFVVIFIYFSIATNINANNLFEINYLRCVIFFYAFIKLSHLG